MPRTQLPGSSILDATVGPEDLQDGAVTGPKLGTGAIIGVDIMPWSPEVAVISQIITKTQSGPIGLAEGGLVMADCTNNAMTLTLPPVADSEGLSFSFKKIDASLNICTISTNAPGELLDCCATYDLAVQNAYLMIRSDGVAWRLLSSGPPSTSMPTMANGEPAYFDHDIQEFISISRATFPFAINSTSARNVYLRMFGGISGGQSYGLASPRNAYITDIVVQVEDPLTVDSEFQLRLNGSVTPVYTIVLPAGQTTTKVSKVMVPINELDQIQMYYASSKNARLPMCTMQLAWRT